MRLDSFQAPYLCCASGLAEVRLFETLASTQTYATEMLEQAAPALPAAVIACRQTAGRGQRSNAWWSDGGCLTATFLFPVKPQPQDGPPLVPLRSGWAIHQALCRHVPSGRLSLKWPNDVLGDGRKLAGLLCARLGGVDLIGVGINIEPNWTEAPPLVQDRAVALGELAPGKPTRAQVFVDVALALRQMWETPEDSVCCHEQINSVHHFNGRDITVDVDAATALRGRCLGIDPQGRLMVQDRRGEIHRLWNGSIRWGSWPAKDQPMQEDGTAY